MRRIVAASWTDCGRRRQTSVRAIGWHANAFVATGPDVLLLDEPFAAVDDLLRLRLQEDVRQLYERKHLTTILVTHNLHEAVFMSDRVVVLGGSPSKVVDSISVSGPRSRSAEYRQSPAFYNDLRSVTAALFRTPVSGKESGDA